MENQSESLMASGTAKKARKVPADNRMHGLDFLRIIFALLIVFGHYRVGAVDNGVFEGDPGPRIYNFIRFAVEMFFVLSGLLIAKSVKDRSYVNYMIARIVRITPALLFCATITFAVAVILADTKWGVRADWQHWLASVTVLPLLINDTWGIDWPYWSLTYEFRFYFLAGFYMIFFKSERALLIATAVWMAASFFALVIDNVALQTLTVSRASGCFAMGIMLHFITSVPRYRMQALIVMIPSLIVAQMSMMREAGIRHINGDDFILYWPEAVGATLFMVIVIGAFVYVPMPKRADKALQLGGMMTYPLYLLHMFVGWVIIAKCAAHGMRIDLAILTAMIVIVPVAVAISAWGEPFVGKYLKAALKSSTNAIEPHLPKALWKLLYTPQAKRRMVQPAAASTADAQPVLPVQALAPDASR